MSDLPVGWENAILKDVCDVIRGITFPASAKEENLLDSNVCCLRTSNIQREILWDNIYFISREYVKRKEQLVQVGDILMSMANSYELVGKVAIAREVPFPTAFGAFLAAIRPTVRIDGKFLFHLLRSGRVQELLRVGSSQTVNIANISARALSEIGITLPPLNEQKRIADKLDTLLAAVDACRARLDKVPTLIKRFRQSVLAAATSGVLTDELDENAYKKIHVGALLSDIRYGTSKKCHYEPKATPVIRIPNICEGSVSHADLKFASFDEAEKKTLALMSGDILIIRSNGSVDLVGRTALITKVDEGLLYAGYLIRLRVDHKMVNPAYLSLALSAPDVRTVIELTARSTSGVNNINTEEIKALEISMPPLKKQNEVVRRVEALFAIADKLEASLATARKRVDQLTPAILAQAFRGELVEQDPTDEPASALLARITAASMPAAPKRALKKAA